VSNNHATEYAYQIEPEDTVKFNNNSCKTKKPCFPMVFPTLICSGRKTTQWKICKKINLDLKRLKLKDAYIRSVDSVSTSLNGGPWSGERVGGGGMSGNRSGRR
jgi:hypothetical protein